MEVTVTKGRPEDYADIIDFGNMVFHEDFRALLPKLYDNRPEAARHHHLVWEDGRIKAVVGSFPISLSVAGQALKVRGIGTVSVHPYARSRGYMKTLMQNAVQEAEDEGAALMVLSGRRQRYEYFGFSKGPSEIQFHLDPTVRRHLKSVSTDGLELIPLTDHKEYLRECCQLLEAQPVHAVRSGQDFCDITQSWGSTAYVVLLRGQFLGFCSIRGDKSVQELYLKDYGPSANVAMKLCEQINAPFRLIAFPFQQELIHSLNLISEDIDIFEGVMMNVLDYPAVIRAFLSLKGADTPLADGKLVIEVMEKGRYAVTVQDGAVSVEPTEEKPKVSLSHLRMMNYLFSPLGQFGGGQKSPEEISWLPIPICFPECDNV